MEKKTTILYWVFSVIILIFNLAALGTNWYILASDNYVTGFYLAETVTCVDGGGCHTESYSDYSDYLKENGQKDAAKDVDQTAAGGGLCILFLVINLLINIAVMIVYLAFLIPQIGDKIPQITKNPIILSKAPFLILLLVPCQLIALFWWVALFGGYDDVPDGFTLGGGAGIGLTVITIILPAVGFAVAKFVFKEGGVGAPAATTTPAPA